MSFEGDQIKIGNHTYDLTGMDSDQRSRFIELKLEQEHRGHEAMHMEMFVLAIAFLVISQILLFFWRKKSPKTYHSVTLLFLILVPLLLSIRMMFIRFLFFYFIFISASSFIIFRATRKIILPSTPKLVYKWFLLAHNVTYFFGCFGYILLLITMFIGGPEILVIAASNMLLYGIYFGVVSRDLAEFSTEKMASKIGYYSPDGIPMRNLDPNVCCLCTHPLQSEYLGDKILSFNDANSQNKLFKLNCSHVFHDFCIRGWCIIGKKDICPYCKEKVDLKNTFTNPWEKPHILYGNYLDWIRYVIAWQPMVLFILGYVYHILGLH